MKIAIKEIKKIVVSFALIFLLSLTINCSNIYAEDIPAVGLECSYDIVSNQVIVNVILKNNPGVIGLRTLLSYDGTAFKIKSFTDTGLLSGSQCETSENGLLKNPYRMMWYTLDANATDNKSNGIVATFVFDVNEGTAGSYVFSLEMDSKNTKNAAGDKVYFSVESTTVEIPKYVYVAQYSSTGKMISIEEHDAGKSYALGTKLFGLSEAFRPLMIYEIN